MDEEDRQDLANPLGISGEPVPQDESDRIRASDDEASVRRRRKRAGLGPDGDDRTTDGLGDLNNDPDGAAGSTWDTAAKAPISSPAGADRAFSGVYLRKVERAVPMERPGNRGRRPDVIGSPSVDTVH